MTTSFAEFYRGKTVLVTGHTGFVGGWLTAWLKMLGARVVGYSLPPDRKPNLFEAGKIEEGIVSITGDIRDEAALLSVYREHAPEIVFHNAAQSLVRRSYREPVTTYATNVMGTVHVLEAARQSPSVAAIVVVTSDKCYENKEWVWGYREGEPLGGRDPYSSSKACAELVTTAYRLSFFEEAAQVALATARAGNIFGGGDWAEDRLVPDIVRSVASGTPVVLRHPTAIRPWQHVLEPVRAYLRLAQLLCDQGARFAGSWNFGPREDDMVSVAELARRMLEYWGASDLPIQLQPGTPGQYETHTLKLDCSKARATMGWRPVLSLEEGLKLCVHWYRDHLKDPGTAPEITASQIRGYSDRVHT